MIDELPTNNESHTNLGTRRIVKIQPPRFPSADTIVRDRAVAQRSTSKVDILLVNPPSPDGGGDAARLPHPGFYATESEPERAD